jgi:hypothetical protein
VGEIDGYEGVESSCGIHSLIETAKQNGLEPLDYL